MANRTDAEILAEFDGPLGLGYSEPVAGAVISVRARLQIELLLDIRKYLKEIKQNTNQV